MKTWRLVVAAAALVMVAACSNPEADWQKAEAENTEAAYQAFLEKHPEGEWAQKAQSQLDAIKDTRDWENAQTSDAIEAYNNYLLAHPTGAHMGEARQRITDLETEAAWSTAQTAGTREALEDFLIRYADAPQAEQARAQLAALHPAASPAEARAEGRAKAGSGEAVEQRAPSIPKGDYQVQLGAFSTLDKAQAEKARMEKKLPQPGRIAVRPEALRRRQALPREDGRHDRGRGALRLPEAQGVRARTAWSCTVRQATHDRHQQGPRRPAPRLPQQAAAARRSRPRPDRPVRPLVPGRQPRADAGSQRDERRHRQRGRPAVLAHGAAEVLRRARLRVLHEPRQPQGAGNRAPIRRSRCSSSGRSCTGR